MSDETKKPPVPPMATAPPKAVEAIPVQQLWLSTERNVPLLDNEGGMRIIRAGRGRKNGLVEIQYEPWQRHHRVREIVDGVVRYEFCVHESEAIYVVASP